MVTKTTTGIEIYVDEDGRRKVRAKKAHRKMSVSQKIAQNNSNSKRQRVVRRTV